MSLNKLFIDFVKKEITRSNKPLTQDILMQELVNIINQLIDQMEEYCRPMDVELLRDVDSSKTGKLGWPKYLELRERDW